MAGVSDQELTIARVYGSAMLHLAQATGEVDSLLEELRDLAGRVEQDEKLDGFLTDPTVDTAARTLTIERLFRGKYSDLFVNSLLVLNLKGRLGLVRAVAEAYHLEREDLQGRVEVHVRTASPLSDALREQLRTVVSQQAGKEATLVETIDESLIGGVVVQIGDRKFDASVATKLRNIGEALRERAAREIQSGKTYFEGSAA